MSIFRKNPIRVGDLVIGVNKYGWGKHGVAELNRQFEEPSLVLEISEDSALVFHEQQGPQWYNLVKLERVYVTDEFENVDGRELAAIEFNYSDQSWNEDDNGDKRGDN